MRMRLQKIAVICWKNLVAMCLCIKFWTSKKPVGFTMLLSSRVVHSMPPITTEGYALRIEIYLWLKKNAKSFAVRIRSFVRYCYVGIRSRCGRYILCLISSNHCYTRAVHRRLKVEKNLASSAGNFYSATVFGAARLTKKLKILQKHFNCFFRSSTTLKNYNK